MSVYDEAFYRGIAAGARASAEVVAPMIDDLLAPSSVLDVGCGTGIWASQWPDADGVDGAWVPREDLEIPADRFHAVDLTKAIDMGRRYDVALCLEVGEHLPKKAARCLVDSLVQHADVVVFSAAVPGQGGVDHINEQWPSWWAKLFALRGYQPYDPWREAIWWDQRIDWWYRQNIIVFAKHPISNLEIRKKRLDLAQPPLLIPELRGRLEATVCIPWRPSPSRLAAFDRVQAFWSMFGWPVVTADSDTEVFSLAQARNNAVRKATTDVVVISDADTLIDPINVVRAVAEPDGVCWPFTRYRILAEKYLETPLNDIHRVPHVNVWDGWGTTGVGGCLVARQQEYWRLGGQPPEFIGWGWEDTAFTAIVRTLSQVKRLPGNAYAFEHNTDAEKYVGGKADSPGWDRDITRNKELFKRYWVADRRPWLMREIIRQRDATGVAHQGE